MKEAPMVDFVGTVISPHLHELLKVALNDRGAFCRFKDVLYNHQAERERWFALSTQCWRERIDDWLKAEGVLSDD